MSTPTTERSVQRVTTKSAGAKKPGRAARGRDRQRRAFALARLAEADGIIYGDLCRAVVDAFPGNTWWWGSAHAVRAVRDLLFTGLATTEPDESCWLTPAGWAAAERARRVS